VFYYLITISMEKKLQFIRRQFDMNRYLLLDGSL
jgi:hypothetical protein